MYHSYRMGYATPNIAPDRHSCISSGEVQLYEAHYVCIRTVLLLHALIPSKQNVQLGVLACMFFSAWVLAQRCRVSGMHLQTVGGALVCHRKIKSQRRRLQAGKTKTSDRLNGSTMLAFPI
jgi:hypothetical protein